MPFGESIHKNRWGHRRFWRLFRRKKSSIVDITYSYPMRFPRLPITVPPLVPTLMSYRCGESGFSDKRNDEDDCEPLPKKLSRDNNHQQQHTRRRLPKRYSDIVGPSITKAFITRKDSNHRISLKSNNNNNNEEIYKINSHNKKSRETISSLPRIETKEHSIVTRRYSNKNKRLSTTNAVDLLAHRMQAAMSTELMFSLDRNFVFGDKKHPTNSSHINRSQSFNISAIPSSNNWWERSLEKEHYYHIIPRVKSYIDEEQKSFDTVPSIDEPTPDYDEEIIIRRMNNDTDDDVGEEPIADYDDPKPTSTYEYEEKSMTPTSLYDLGVSSSFIIPQTSITPSSETYTQAHTSIPPTPPPLPFSAIEQKKTTFRCRTIADQITADHKLILKDELETITNSRKEKQSVPQIQREHSKRSRRIPVVAPKPYYLHLSKELLDKSILRKVSQPVSRPYSSYGSMSQLNDHHTESTVLHQTTSIVEEQPLDGLSSSTTSIVIENDYDHKSSSKIYNDYKRRTSLISIPTNTSSTINPIHTHIGLRSSTSSSSTNDKLNDITLSNKQMNVCVINQLNEHLSTRFRKQHHDVSVTTDTINQTIEDISTNIQPNVYDEPRQTEIKKSPHIFSSSVPPPPPPLPVGGFRPFISQLNRPLSSQRTSVMTLPREINGSDLGFGTGTSTTSSKLSDTRILRELRTNPLFTKAKQHLEIDPNRRLIESSVSYLRLNTCSKGNSSTNVITDQKPMNSSMETFIMCPDKLNNIISDTTKRTKSMNSIANERSKTKTILQTQCRQSELELIFQKRAQRSEHNLT